MTLAAILQIGGAALIVIAAAILSGIGAAILVAGVISLTFGLWEELS